MTVLEELYNKRFKSWNSVSLFFSMKSFTLPTWWSSFESKRTWYVTSPAKCLRRKSTSKFRSFAFRSTSHIRILTWDCRVHLSGNKVVMSAENLVHVCEKIFVSDISHLVVMSSVWRTSKQTIKHFSSKIPRIPLCWSSINSQMTRLLKNLIDSTPKSQKLKTNLYICPRDPFILVLFLLAFQDLNKVN